MLNNATNFSASEIRTLLHDSQVAEAISALNVALNDMSLSPSQRAEAYYLLGNAHRKNNNWREALNNYSEAIAINPNSPAQEAYDSVQEILAFFNKDLYNP